MGGYIGRYSRSPFSVFNEEKNYLFGLTQEGIPVTDDDQNDSRISAFTQVRRMAQLFGDYGTPNTSFIVEEGAAHAVEFFAVTNTITLAAAEGDVSAQYFAGRQFTISGSTGTLNDGTFTVVSATSATPTVITTVETVVAELASPAISTLNVNNFRLITSQGPANADIELAGRFFMRGIMCLLLHDVDYNNDLSDLARRSIHPRVTNVYYDAVSHTVVEDSAANWVVGELIGRFVTVDGNGPFEITSNTADEFEILTDVTASIVNGDHYILELSTPGAPRTDDVYLNVYVDEYDSTDDPALEKNLGGNAIEAQLRAKVIQTLFVREGGAAFADYVDSNGNQHFVFKIATLARDANNTITQAEITSHTPAIGFEDIDLDELTPLRANITSPAGATVFVAPGQALSASGNSIVTWPGGDSPPFDDKEADPRIDALVLEEAGTLAIVKGTTHPTTPVVPLFYGVPIVFVDIAAGSGPPTIQTVDLTDARTLYAPGSGWTVLSASAGTLAAQLNGNMLEGTRYWLAPGAWTLGADLIVDIDGITIAGSRSSTVTQGAYAIKASGDGFTMFGFDIAAGAAVDSEAVEITGDSARLSALHITCTERIRGISVTGTAELATISDCDVTIDAGSAVGLVEGVVCDSSAGVSHYLSNVRVVVSTTISRTVYGIHVDSGCPESVVDDCSVELPANGVSSLSRAVTIDGNYSIVAGLYVHIKLAGHVIVVEASDVQVSGVRILADGEYRIALGGAGASSSTIRDVAVSGVGKGHISIAGSKSVFTNFNAGNAGATVFLQQSYIKVRDLTIFNSANPALWGMVHMGINCAGTSVEGCSLYSNGIGDKPNITVDPFLGATYDVFDFNVGTATIRLDSSEGDKTGNFPAGTDFTVTGATSPGNDGVYTVISSSYDTVYTSLVVANVSEPETASPATITSFDTASRVQIRDCYLKRTDKTIPTIQADVSYDLWTLNGNHYDSAPDPNGARGWMMDEYFEWTTGYIGNVIYQAPCDLIVHVVNVSFITGYRSWGYTDPVPTLTTLVAAFIQDDSQGTGGSLTFAVKKGDYWEARYNTPAPTIHVLAKGR